jgi:SAM-dependent methyltransferase
MTANQHPRAGECFGPGCRRCQRRGLTPPAQPVPPPPPRPRPLKIVGPLCAHWGKPTGQRVECRRTCTQTVRVHGCAAHGECTLIPNKAGLADCETCQKAEPRQKPIEATTASGTALVTLNIGHVMRPEARDSLQHAARRWGAEYHELTEPIEPIGGKPHWQKSMLARWALERGIRKVAYFDSDMLIRSDCPSVLDITPDGTLGIVSNCQFDGPLWKPGKKNRYYRDLEWWARHLSLPVPPMHEHANGGLIVFEPHAHAELFERWRLCGESVKWGRAVKLVDEAALSVLLHSAGGVTWLPTQYNTLFYRSEMLKTDGKMQSYVYHAAGRNKRRLQNVQWHLGSEFSWANIQGMFTFSATYDEQVARVSGPATFVEIGCWKGKSTAYLAAAIKRSGKAIQLYAVDTWKGADNRPQMQKEIRDKHAGDMYPTWKANMRRAGVGEVATAIREPSLDAVRHFQDSSLDFVFLDGDHSFANVVEEIRRWAPKLKPDGVLAGDDFDQEDVARAVRQELPGRFMLRGKTWIRT